MSEYKCIRCGQTFMAMSPDACRAAGMPPGSAVHWGPRCKGTPARWIRDK
jgi:hypothetical protein